MYIRELIGNFEFDPKPSNYQLKNTVNNISQYV